MIIFMLCHSVVDYSDIQDNEFEEKPPRWDQPLYKEQTSGPQCGLSLMVSLYFRHSNIYNLTILSMFTIMIEILRRQF